MGETPGERTGAGKPPRARKRLQAFDVNGDDVLLFMARAWAESTIRMIGESKRALKELRDLNAAWDASLGFEVTEYQIESALRHRWVIDCQLVISARNLEIWTAKLFKDRLRPRHVAHPMLIALRNAILHLDEQSFDEDEWVATPRTTQSQIRGIGALPGGVLPLGLIDSDDLFGVVSHDELERIARALDAELSKELNEYVLDLFADGRA